MDTIWSFLKFWWDCFTWAFKQYGEGKKVIAILEAIFGVAGIGGIWAGFTQGWGYYLLLIPIGFITIFIAPYKLWKQKEIRIRDLTTPRLQVSLPEPEPQFMPGTDKESKLWYHLQVHNPTNVPIKDCFGKLLSFSADQVMADGYPLPRPGLRLAWSTHGGVSCENRTIGVKSIERLDILVYDLAQHVYIPELAQDGWTRNLAFCLPITNETYEAEIQIGSNEEAFEPTSIRIRISSVLKKGKIIPQIELVNDDTKK